MLSKVLSIILVLAIISGAGVVILFLRPSWLGYPDNPAVSQPADSGRDSSSSIIRLDPSLLPQKFPQGLPLEYKVPILQNQEERSGSGEAISGLRVYLSQRSIAEIYENYRSYFDQNGWVMEASPENQAEERVIIAFRPDRQAEIRLTPFAGAEEISGAETAALKNVKTEVSVLFHTRNAASDEATMLPPNPMLIEPGTVPNNTTSLTNLTVPIPQINSSTTPLSVPGLFPVPFDVRIQAATSQSPVVWQEKLSEVIPFSISLRISLEKMPSGERYAAAVWCNLDSVDIDPSGLPQPERSLGGTYDGDPIVIRDVCNYSASGVFSPKVIIGAMGGRAEARAEITALTPLSSVRAPGTVVVPTAPVSSPDSPCIFGAAPVKSKPGEIEIKWECHDPEFACTITPPITSSPPSSAGVARIAPRWTTTYTINCVLGGRSESTTIRVIGGAL